MDAAHAEHRRQPTALLQHPVAKGGQLFGAADEADDIRPAVRCTVHHLPLLDQLESTVELLTDGNRTEPELPSNVNSSPPRHPRLRRV
jgi:hypothetical protein